MKHGCTTSCARVKVGDGFSHSPLLDLKSGFHVNVLVVAF